LITLDLPTFERPRKAISGAAGAGNCAGSTAAMTNLDKTFIPTVHREHKLEP
jgi:hypothetical protein